MALQEKLDDELLSQDKSSKFWSISFPVSLFLGRREILGSGLAYGWLSTGGDPIFKLCQASVSLKDTILVLKGVSLVALGFRFSSSSSGSWV